MQKRTVAWTAFVVCAAVAVGALVAPLILSGLGASSATDTSASSDVKTPTGKGAPNDEKVGAEHPDGTLENLPIVGTEGETLNSVDTTADTRTPATFKDVRQTCGRVDTWKDLVKCIGDNQWYKDAVNARSSNTGFTWADIKKWAKDPQLTNKIQLIIHTYGGGWSDVEARAIAAKYVGQDLASKLQVARHPLGGLVNTLSVGNKKVINYLDRRNLVRVSLAPIVYNHDGTVQGIRENAGIFIDCLNIWWLAKKVWVCQDSSCAPPPPPVTPPVAPPPPVTGCTPNCAPPPPPPPPCTPNCNPGKNAAEDPQNQGNNRTGGGGVAPPAAPAPAPPAAGPPPPVYVPPPAPPAPAPAAPPVAAEEPPAPAPEPVPAAPGGENGDTGGF